MSEAQGIYDVPGRKEIRQGCLIPYASPGYTSPDKDEIREAIRLSGLTGSKVADLVGVKSARTVRKWVGGEQPIPYAAWRLILQYIGLAQDDPYSMAADNA